MLHSTKIVEAWKSADDFNKQNPVGSTVIVDGNPVKVSNHAYVINPNQIVVQVNNNQAPVRLSNVNLVS